MVKDTNGVEVRAGDLVRIVCRVVSISPDEGGGSLVVMVQPPDEPRAPGHRVLLYHPTLCCPARAVEVLEPADGP